jgi:hypothetical protein
MASQSLLKSKYTFVLAISTFQVDQIYGFNFHSRGQNPQGTTLVKDIYDDESNIVTLYDANKKSKRYNVALKSMIKNACLPNKTLTRCWWCHQTFATSPLGCPIRYVASILQHKYYSPILKSYVVQNTNITYADEVVWKQKISVQVGLKKRLEDLQARPSLDDQEREELTILRTKVTGDEYNIISNNYFVCDGIMCSFNCCLAYALDKTGNRMYHNSEALVYDMYLYLVGKRALKIIPSGPFTLLQDYDGPYSREEYRERFNTDTYTYTGNVYIRLVPLGKMYALTQKF